jgi:hypothetical protein
MEVRWTLNRTNTGYEGVIDLPTPDGRIIRARGLARYAEPDAKGKALARGAQLALREVRPAARKALKKVIKTAIRTGKGKAAVKAALATAALPIPGARAVAALALLGRNKKVRRFVARKGKRGFKRVARRLLR